MNKNCARRAQKERKGTKMEPKEIKMEPMGAKREPKEAKGNKNEPKGRQNEPQRQRGQREPKGTPKELKEHPTVAKGNPKSPKGIQRNEIYERQIQKLPINRPSGCNVMMRKTLTFRPSSVGAPRGPHIFRNECVFHSSHCTQSRPKRSHADGPIWFGRLGTTTGRRSQEK